MELGQGVKFGLETRNQSNFLDNEIVAKFDDLFTRGLFEHLSLLLGSIGIPKFSKFTKLTKKFIPKKDQKDIIRTFNNLFASHDRLLNLFAEFYPSNVSSLVRQGCLI